MPISALEQLQHVLKEEVFTKPQLTVLEAGCGSSSNFELPQSARVVGIDISQTELDKNTVVSEKICGDVQTHPLPKNNYDLIVCWDVLEHLERPELAMNSFVNAAKPGGYILLAFPNVQSVKGIVTKFTPFSVHKSFYKLVYGAEAGEIGVMPFPTYLRWTISKNNVKKFADSNGLHTAFDSISESGLQRRFRERVHLKGYAAEFIDGLAKTFTLGTVNLFDSDCIYLFRKPGEAVAAQAENLAQEQVA